MFLPLILAAWAAGSLLDRRQAVTVARGNPGGGMDGLHPRAGCALDRVALAQLPAHRCLPDLGCGRARHSERARPPRSGRERTEEEARRAVEEERSRITRELHDVLAHSVSVMTVQASAVRRLLTPEQEREREALLTVEETGRQALAEMRRLLGIMRSDHEVAALAPQPGLGTLPELVEQVRQSGLPVELSVEGEPVKLPAGVDLSAYRIVQEALTNALKHAGPAHAWVSVRYADDDVEIEVENDGRDRRSGRRRRPRPGRHARARRALRRRAALGTAARAAGSGSRRGCRWQDHRVTVRVLIVDDQALVRAGFRMILESEPDIEIVGEAEDGLAGGRGGPRPQARRRADGHPDAEPGRARGDAADPRRRAARARAS